MRQWVPEPEAVRRYYEDVSARAYERAGGGGRAGSGREVGSDREPGDSCGGRQCGGI